MSSAFAISAGARGGAGRRLVPPWLLAGALIPALTSTPAAAQERRAELRLGATVLELGEAVDGQLVLTNTAAPELPQVRTPDGIDLRITNAFPSQSTQMQWVNGRSSQHTTYVYPVRLTARKVGRYTIPPIAVQAGGQTYRTDPVQVTVRETETDASPTGDRYIFVELSVEPTEVYVTETVTATLVIGIRKVQLGGQVYDVDLLRDVLDVRSSQLSVFGGSQARESTKWITDSNGERHIYAVYTVQTQLTAEQVGPMPIGPVFLKAQYPTALRRGFFGGLEVSRARPESARADAITVAVKSPPMAGRPADFAGAIGRFNMGVTAKPSRVEKGQPVTLTIAIEGDPIESVAGPDLAANAELVSRFDFARDELVGDLEGRAKLFRRAIFPKQQGTQGIPPISWSYFDPDDERYHTLQSEAIPITVDPPSAGSTAIILADTATENGAAPTRLTVLAGGISPNYVDAEQLLANQTFTLRSLPGTLLLGLPPMLCLFAMLTSRYRERVRGDAAFARRRGAQRRARAALRRALNGDPAQDPLHGVSAAFAEYISDRFNMPPGRVTSDELGSVLAQQGIDDGVIREITEFFETCDAGRFMPGANHAISPELAAQRVRAWIRRLERTGR